MTLDCYRCDASDEGDLDTLPSGWACRESLTLGRYPICADCVAKETPPAKPSADPDAIPTAAQSRLKTIIERIERLEEDKAVIVNDIKEVYAEAKGEGFDTGVLRLIVRERKKDPFKREEEQAIFDLYASAIGGL